MATSTSPDTVAPVAPPQPWLVLRYNHFDPLWRRCWDRPIDAGGKRYASYRQIEERWIGEALAIAEADGESCFMVECSWVLRHYLERHPQQRATVRRLAREGRFELLGSGENIVDANLIHGELLARNLALGTWWAEAELGVRPDSGWHSDGFGSSAQMPQIFRQCGYDWLPAISYNTPDAPYWRGLDGSVIYFAMNAGHAAGDGPAGERLPHRLAAADCYRKHAPCAVCAGSGRSAGLAAAAVGSASTASATCAACEGFGFVAGARAELGKLPDAPLPGAAGVILLWGEELLPGRDVPGAIARFNATHPAISVRQGLQRHLRPYIADLLARVDDPPAAQVSSKVENNPSQSGCYVSRIVIKQGHRALEHALLGAECWDALLVGGASRDTLRDAWRKMTLSAFHDSITSSHCDEGYDELRDLHRDLSGSVAAVAGAATAASLRPEPQALTVFNHTHRAVGGPLTVSLPDGWAWASATIDGAALPVSVADGDPRAVTVVAPAIPALGARTIRLAPAARAEAPLADRVLRCGRYTVTVGDHGISGLAVDGLGTVADTTRFQLGELVLEHDHGDPWATRSLDRTREALGQYTKLVSIVRHGDGVVVTFTGRHPSCDDPHRCADPAVSLLTWTQRVHLRPDVAWIEVDTEVQWYTQGRRLRLAFPSNTTQDRGVYDVPYGTLERARYEGTTNHGGNAGGDWPALHWAGVQAADHTFAVFNHGTPSHRVEDGAVMVSVLRSPMLPYALLEPESYVLHNYQGMADHGTHRFRHAIHIAPGDWRSNGVGDDAALFNGGLTAQPGALRATLPAWGLDLAHTRLTAVKSAEDGRGVILRLVEASGASEVVRITPPAGFTRAEVCTLLEDPGREVMAKEGVFAVAVKAWEIVSVRFFFA